jgi:integrase
VKKGTLAANPALLIPLPRVRTAEHRPLDAAGVQTLLRAAAGDPLEELYWLAVDTGARQGELFALRWGDWNEAAATLSISQTLENRIGKLRFKEPKTRSSR